MPTDRKVVVPPMVTQSFVVVPVSLVVGSAFFSRAALRAARSSLRGGAVARRRSGRRSAAAAARASMITYSSARRWRVRQQLQRAASAAEAVPRDGVAASAFCLKMDKRRSRASLKRGVCRRRLAHQCLAKAVAPRACKTLAMIAGTERQGLVSRLVRLVCRSPGAFSCYRFVSKN